MKAVYHPEFKASFDLGRKHYQDITEALAERFQEEVKAGVAEVLGGLVSHARGPHGFRCYRCKKFPYLVYYQLDGESALFPVAKLRIIRRQDTKLAGTIQEKRSIAAYRAAVRLASKGQSVRSFDQLAALGWVHEHGPAEGRELLAKEYLAARERNEHALIVAQTWIEVDAVTNAVRAARRAAGQLGTSTELLTYRAVDLTEAEKQTQASYGPDSRVFFLKRYGRHLRGDICEVAHATDRGIVLRKDGREFTVGFKYADRWSLIGEHLLEIAPGDRLQLKWNGQSLDGKPLANGELVTVREIFPDGRIAVESDRREAKVLGPNQRLFNFGYAITSYASQGKTVDTVLFSDDGSRAATNQKQWYVSISRGRKRALVFTPDSAALRAAIAADGHRRLAVEGMRDGWPVGQVHSMSRAQWHQALMEQAIPAPSQSIAAGVRL